MEKDSSFKQIVDKSHFIFFPLKALANINFPIYGISKTQEPPLQSGFNKGFIYLFLK